MFLFWVLIQKIAFPEWVKLYIYLNTCKESKSAKRTKLDCLIIFLIAKGKNFVDKFFFWKNNRNGKTYQSVTFQCHGVQLYDDKHFSNFCSCVVGNVTGTTHQNDILILCSYFNNQRLMFTHIY